MFSVKIEDKPAPLANGANGMSDIEGKVAREAMSECGQRASFNISQSRGTDPLMHHEPLTMHELNRCRGSRVGCEKLNGADGISDIEGKATRVGASERGQRMSFKTAVLFGAAALWCVPCLAKAQSADERLRAIYTEEWKWRLEQFPGLEGVAKPVS